MMIEHDNKTVHGLAVLYDVREERKRQDEKWGEQNHNPFVYLAILGEEVGEANQAALHAHKWVDGRESAGWDTAKLSHYREELIQVAAVAVAMVECLDRGEWMVPAPPTKP